MFQKLTVAFLLVVSFNAFSFSPCDSIGIEKKGGKTYIIHKVEAKETLYSIARKYNVTVDEIKNANEDLTADLKIGQTILVPSRFQPAATNARNLSHTIDKGETLYSIARKYKVTVADIKKANPEIINADIQPGQVLVIPTEAKEEKDVSKEDEKQVTHKVSEKETYYSIAKKYSITVPELKDANPAVTELKVGHVLVIPMKAKEEDKKENDQTDDKAKSGEGKNDKNYMEVKNPVNNVTAANMPPLNNLKKESYTKVSETGMVEVYQETSGFHYALHKTAPVGTIIYLVNEATGQKVYVRVMGKLTDETPGLIMKISPKAYEKIARGGESKIKVTASYIP
jgi:LysM repeat protein